jgi:hypothetical protein
VDTRAVFSSCGHEKNPSTTNRTSIYKCVVIYFTRTYACTHLHASMLKHTFSNSVPAAAHDLPLNHSRSNSPMQFSLNACHKISEVQDEMF